MSHGRLQLPKKIFANALALVAATLGNVTLAAGPASANLASTPPTTPPTTVVQYKADLVKAAATKFLPRNLVTPLAHVTNKNALYQTGCHSSGTQPGVSALPCTFATTASSSSIWLIGDSHAAQWFPAVEAYAKSHGASLTVHTKSSCPIMSGVPTAPHTSKPYLACKEYNDWILTELQRAKPDLLVVAGYQGIQRLYLPQVSLGLDRVAIYSAHVAILGDTPKQLSLLPPCLKAHQSDIQTCAPSLDRAYYPSVTNALTAAARRNGYWYVDTRSWFCTAAACPPVIANRVVYADATHISIDAAEYFSNRLAMALNAQTWAPKS